MEIKDADFKRICELAFEAGKIAGRKEGREEMLKEVFTSMFEIANPKSANAQVEVEKHPDRTKYANYDEEEREPV